MQRGSGLASKTNGAGETIQLAAGLGGAGNLDFDAVTQASTAVEQFLGFIASRLGGSVDYR